MIVGLVVALIIVSLIFRMPVPQNPDLPKDTGNIPSPGDQVACPADAMVCPDGSVVGRRGPRCEFAPCVSPSPSTSTGIQGLVHVGPQCPVVRVGEDCPDKPFKTSLSVTTPDGSRVIKNFSSDESGHFSVNVPAGSYAIRSAAAANVLPYCSTNATIVVTVNAFTFADVSCDSGIR